MAEDFGDWIIYHYIEVDSTNDIIKNYCTENGKKIVVWADKQTAGRGRLGRKWQSLSGNLLFSAAFEFDISKLGNLVMICGLSLCQVIKDLQKSADVKIKLPNDVLLNEAKIGGILLEKGPNDYMIIGIGVNTAQHPTPDKIMYAATSLQNENIIISAENLLKKFLLKFDKNLIFYRQDEYSEKLRREWLKFAKGVGQTLTVNQYEQKICGVFKDIDKNANLLLEDKNGVQQIRAGDVFFNKKEEI